MSHGKISVVVLGNGKSLKKALITNILGRDLSELTQRKIPKVAEIYEDETCVFTCIPNLGSECGGIASLFSKNPPPDLCLLVLEDGFSSHAVWQQIKELSEITRKDRDVFKVVVPVGYEPAPYPFRCFTIQQVYSEVEKLAVAKGLTLRNIRSADNPVSQNEREVKRKYTSTKVNLVLLGMAGTGKSASGNTILGKRVFTSKPSSTQVTTECQVAETQINGTHVRVIDTPDMFDDDIEASVRDRHVRRCRELCESGPCVFVLVMHVSRFTDGERDVLRKLEKAFGKKVHEQTVILFTRGDDLQRDGMNLETFLNSCQPDLKEIVEKCGNRCVVFENSRSNPRQERKLMDTVISMLEEEQTL